MPFAISRNVMVGNGASVWFGATVAAAMLAAPQPAASLTLYEQEVTCPIDGQTFKATLVGTYMAKGMRLDLKPLGDVIAPYPYPVCPGNGFVMYQNEFSADELTAIKSIVASDDFKALRQEHTDHAMVAYLKQRLGARDFDVAESFLQASWEAERDRPQLVDEYRALALDAFDAARERGNLNADDGLTAAVVSAELERLLGDFASAQARLTSLEAELSTDAVGEAAKNNATLAKVIDQIALHTFNRNDEPEALSDQMSTIGSGAR